jgi:hypothetical protein
MFDGAGKHDRPYVFWPAVSARRVEPRFIGGLRYVLLLGWAMVRYTSPLLLLLVATCGGKSDDKPSDKPVPPPSSPPPTATVADAAPAPAPSVAPLAGLAGGGPLGLSGIPASAGPAPSVAAREGCQRACDQRASCGLGDASGCVAECAALVDLGSLEAKELEAYAASPCDQVRQTEPRFRLASACRHACAHRAACIPDATVKECIPDCAALVVASKQAPDAVLGPYMQKDCAGVKADEPGLACLRACSHALGCGVAGDLPTCLDYCGGQLKQGATVAQVAAVAKADCQTVKAQVQLPQPAAGGGRGGGILCRAQGIYQVCDGAYCSDRLADSMGAAARRDEAEYNAVATCTSHMMSAIAIQSINNRAASKQSCRIVSCQ